MPAELLWYGLVGIVVAVTFCGLLFLNIRLERARRNAEAKMSPSERREKEAFAKASGTGWVSPL
jgi:hypothetical protein